VAFNINQIMIFFNVFCALCDNIHLRSLYTVLQFDWLPIVEKKIFWYHMAVNEHERLSNITHEHKLSEKIKGTKFWLLLYIWQYGLQQWAYMIDWLVGV
jgi:hypothetical protein